MIAVEEIASPAFDDQRPGTAGLRKKVAVIQQPHYLENFLQAIFSSTDLGDGPLVIGGDGRFYNEEAIQTCLAIAAGNGIKHFIIGQNGLLSTPAASHVIRKYQAKGGLVLSASHNPAGPEGDFGIKFNVANGGQASEQLTEAIFQNSLKLESYRYAQLPAVSLAQVGKQQHEAINIEIIDSVSDYAELMQSLFDFDLISDMLRKDQRLAFDAMHAVTGPYAKRILGELLGAKTEDLLNCEPKPDFGGGHPDPNQKYAKTLINAVMAEDGPSFGAASDGDGDRNMILGRGIFVSPGDSLAMLADNLPLCPGYQTGLTGVARSMPTCRALDKVAAIKELELHETPTGWRFFCNLLDAGRIELCGEESFGTGSNHVREKDGLWAVLAWLNIMAARKASVAEIAASHWRTYGRHYYQRHDYEGLTVEAADALIEALKNKLSSMPHQSLEEMTLTTADEFTYIDPIDDSISPNQGIRLCFGEDARVIIRLSGTGTAGATLRLYFERYANPQSDHNLEPAAYLSSLVQWTTQQLELEAFLGRSKPDVVT